MGILTLKKKIALGFLVIVITLGAINFSWVGYVAHLARHQAGVIFGKEKIAERLQSPTLDANEKNLLQETLKIRAFLEKAYGLQNSKSYRYFYDLKRNYLGFNITVVPRFSLKPEAFHFWPIGSFDYLGFFDLNLAESWAERYRKKGYDVYLSEIGGYSTLGWFEDPLYSTQLKGRAVGLVLLLAHELAHEKLYFKNDTMFSELLASFIERKAARAYLIATGRKVASEKEKEAYALLVKTFSARVDKLKMELEALYNLSIADTEKLHKKEQLLAVFREWLVGHKTLRQKIPAARELAAIKDLNNAVLVQFHRYNPMRTQFSTVYEKCEKVAQPFGCFFDALAPLKDYTKNQRREWLKGAG